MKKIPKFSIPVTMNFLFVSVKEMPEIIADLEFNLSAE